MKRLLEIGFTAALFCLLVGCSESGLDGLLLNAYVVELQEDSTFLLKAGALSGEAVLSEVSWTSSDPAIVSVSSDGLITGLQAGTTTITAAVDGYTAECAVMVTPTNLALCMRMGKSAKRGVSYAFSIDGDVDLLASCISWSYNWGTSPATSVQADFDRYGLDFCPMAWNGNYNAEAIRTYKREHAGCTYLLAFNEPNLTDQCNYTPAEAAAKWPELKALAQELNMKIVSPAMNYGTLAGYGDPVVWLDEFFAQDGVSVDDVSAIAIHCYMGKSSAVKSYINRFSKYGKPIWLTEFCAWENFISSIQAQMEYMSETINYLEYTADVERYAWFIPRASGSLNSYPYMQLLTKEQPFELSELGKVFAGLSSSDQTVWHPAEERILAQEYVETCVSEGQTGFHLRPTTDVGGQLEVYDWLGGQWMEYQVENTEATTGIQLRCRVAAPAVCQFLVDGTEVVQLTLPDVSDNWITTTIAVPINAGKHVLRLRLVSGKASLHWLRLKK